MRRRREGEKKKRERVDGREDQLLFEEFGERHFARRIIQIHSAPHNAPGISV
jgi:hypothetical protein